MHDIPWHPVTSELRRRLSWYHRSAKGILPSWVTKPIGIFTLVHNNPQLVGCLTFVTAWTILCFFLICLFKLQVSSLRLIHSIQSFWKRGRIAPRRLPHRTDYILTPAPLGTSAFEIRSKNLIEFCSFVLDLSLSEATEKSLLPAIIVTPSSPSSSRDFSIAFLADPPKLSLLDRFASWKHYGGPLPFRFRYILIVLFITFALICHLAVERLAMRVPYLELNAQNGNNNGAGWLGFPFFGDTPALLHPNFIISEPSGLH